MFELRNFPNPVDFSDENNWTTIIVHNLEREENIAKRRKPLNSKIFAKIIEQADLANEDGLEALVANVCAAGRTLGFRRGEICQTKADKVDYHTYPSGKKVMKALSGNSIRFMDANEKEMIMKSNTNLDRLESGKTKFDHQKNRQNAPEIGMAADKKHRKTCALTNIALMVKRKRRFGHPMDLPLAVYKNKKGHIKYLTGATFTNMIRRAVKEVYPDITREELLLYSCHSVRVWACVELYEAGKAPDFIKKRLRWLGESYRVYLRDTIKTNEQHNDALQESSQAVMDLLDSAISEELEFLSEEDIKNSGEYDDED